MKISSGYTTYILDVTLIHPDMGNVYDQIAFNFDDGMDYENNEEFTEIMCAYIWDKLNYGRYYHEMEIRHTIIVDDSIYIWGRRYNGYEVKNIPTVIKHVID